MYAINTPASAMLVWRVVRNFLDARTINKIKIMGGESEWRPVLQALMAPGQDLPRELGGGGAACLPTEPAFLEIRLEYGEATTVVVRVEAAAAAAAGEVRFSLFVADPSSVASGLVFGAALEDGRVVLPERVLTDEEVCAKVSHSTSLTRH